MKREVISVLSAIKIRVPMSFGERNLFLTNLREREREKRSTATWVVALHIVDLIFVNDRIG